MASNSTSSSVERRPAEACIADAVRRIADHFQPLQILLFGSQARGTARPDSDIDLLVVFEHIENRVEKMTEIRRVLRGLGCSTDVIVATPEQIENRSPWTGEVLYYAMPESRVLYDREDGPDRDPVTMSEDHAAP